MFRLRAYGGLSLERDGVPYDGPASQRRRIAVLAVIAASSDAGVSRERLMGLFWPDADAPRARHSLDEALSGLRREFRSDDAFVGVSTLRVNHHVLSSDLAERAAALVAGDAERAVALYTGPFLDGFYIPGTADFEHWVDAERSARTREHARVLESLATAATARAETATAVRWWQARVALDPLDTPATLSLLLAHSSAGNTPEALRVARVHEALIRQELDASPGPEWAASVEALRAESARVPRVVSAAATDARSHAAPAPAHIQPRLEESDPAPAPFSVMSERPTTTPLSSLRAAPFSRRHTGSWIAACVLILAVVAFAVRSVWPTRTAPEEQAATLSNAAIASERNSVAILPFVSINSNPGDEPFADGLTDELISALSGVSGVRVTGRTSAFALKGRGLTVRTIADTLGVTTVFEGSVRRDGTRLKVTARLISAVDNGVLWSQTYDRKLQDVFAVQEDIARAIVRALAPTLGGSYARIGMIAPRDLATYELYLRGRYFLGRRSPADLRRATEAFEQAVARDSTFAKAYAGLADTRVLLVLLGNRPPDEELPRARAAAAAAIRLDSTVAEAYAALGNIREAFDWDTPGADRELARALELDPGYGTAHLYRGIHWLNLGRFEDAVAELTLARTLDPLSAAVHMQLGRAYSFASRPNDAVGFLRTAVELNAEFAAAHVQLGDAYLQQGQTDAALSAFRRAALLTGGRDSAHLAYALAISGKRDVAVDMIGSQVARADRRYVPPVPIAKAYVALDSMDAAFRWLERGVDERAAHMRTINVAPAFYPLRGDPRWRSLLDRIGLAP